MRRFLFDYSYICDDKWVPLVCEENVRLIL